MVGRRVLVLFLAAAPFTGSLAGAQAPASPPPAASQPASSSATWSVRNTTRVESWRFFEPKPGPAAGDPNYTFIANRLFAGVRYAAGKYEIGGALQYVQFGGLPEDATGPGALGTGALYFDHSGDTASRQLYLKSLQLR